jgi:CheY-like chemotaxis protein
MPAPHLLLIDDSPDVAALVTLLARRSGQTVTVATSAEAGLGVLDTAAFDLILVDVNLPGMDGIEFSRRVLPREPQPPLAVFIQSGLLDDLVRAVSAGVDYAFYKDHMKSPPLWSQRSGEILDGLAGRLPAWLLPLQGEAASPPNIPIRPQPHLVPALEVALGHQRAATLGLTLLARAWRRVLPDAPVDLARELPPDQATQLAQRLAEGVWRLLGTDESQRLRVALGLSGAKGIS